MILRIQKPCNVWIEEIYEVDEYNPEVLEKIREFEIDPTYVETLWDTMKETGPFEVFDNNYNLIDKYDFSSK